MELDQLKTVWQKTTQKEVEGYFISADEVKSLIKKRSNTAVAEIKRGVRNKVFMAGGIGSLMIMVSIIAFNSDEPFYSFVDFLSSPEANTEVGIFYLVFGLVICFISVFNAFSYKQILNVEKLETDLKTSIKSVLSIIKKAVRTKIYSDTAVVPITIFSIVAIDLMRGLSFIPSTKILVLLIFGGFAFAIFSYFLTSYGQNKRYGKQIEVLEECLQELEE